MPFTRYFSEKRQIYYWYNDSTNKYHYEKPEELIKEEQKFNNDINDYWTKKMSKKKNKNYWFNKRTGEYSWVDPSMFSDELKPIQKKEREKNEKSSNIEDLLNEVTNLKLEEEEKPPTKPKTNTYSNVYSNTDRNSDRNSEYQDYEICNGMGIYTTISATDKYDAMEQMRDLAQSLNPYD